MCYDGNVKQFNYIGNTLQDIQVKESDGVRFYETPSGLLYPSVTTVLGYETKDGIEKWRKRVGKEEADKITAYAANLGTHIHSFTEHYLKNLDPWFLLAESDLSLHEKMMWNSFKPTLNRIDNIIALEAPLYSNLLKLAGRTDCIAEYEGNLSIIDFKTSRSLKEEYWIENYFMQGAAYSIMYEELTGTRINDVVILIVNYDCSISVYKKKRKTYVKPLITLLRRVLPNFGVQCEI